jgi:hypothetical protein
MQRKGSTLLMMGVVAIVAFAAGYWPQHERYVNAMEQLRASDKQMLAAMASQRIVYLENMMLQVLDLTAHQDYKEAHTLLGQFFVEVHANMARPDMSQYSSQLKAILEKRDAIEAAVEKRDPASRDVLREVMQQLGRIAAPPPPAKEPPVLIPAPAAPQN